MSVDLAEFNDWLSAKRASVLSVRQIRSVGRSEQALRLECP